jgi:hypothetical protein
VKTKSQLLVVLILCFMLLPGITLAQAPTPPVLFQGDVTINDVDAPVGTIIVAEVEGVEAATNEPDDGISEAGKYILSVPDEGYVGKTVVFKIDGVVAGEHEYVSAFESPIIELDLSVGNGSHGTTPLNDYFGLGLKTFIIIVAGVVALIILLIVMIKRHRQYI